VLDRYAREVAFHDDCYAGDLRHVTVKYRTVTQAGEAFRRLLLKTEPGARVLDYGCGRGFTTVFLAGRGYQVTGIDLSGEAVRQARARLGGLDADVVVMNAEQLDFDDDTFDVVCGKGILHHLDLDQAYSEVSRVLKPDGRAVFVEPLGHNPAINLYRSLTPRLRTVDERPLRLNDVRMAGRYFDRVSARFYDLFTLAAVPFRNTAGFDRLLGTLARLDERALKRTRLRRLAWKVVLELHSPR
jgi:SAM-dependent methyltransferase